MDKRHIGIYEKFVVTRTDGSSEPGGKHEHCRYFVLDISHDPFAIPALRAYAEACAAESPVLSVELHTLVSAQLKAAESQATNNAIRPCPYRIEERYADNGALSHYALVEVATGVEVWSQPE